MIFNLIKRKEHLSMEGLFKIVSIKASMNQGLSSQLKDAFLNIVPAARPLILNQKIKDPGASSWLAGFSIAEACFYIGIYKSSYKVKAQVQLNFQIGQHSRDTQLLISLIEFLGCGRYKERKEGLAGNFEV